MHNSKVKEITLISATSEVDNSVDTDRQYAIKANVTSCVAEVRSIEGGEVRPAEGGDVIATFNESQYGGGNIYFNGTNPTAEKRAITNAVYDFIDSVKAMYANPNNE